jgi:hypothetical protein
MKPIETTYKHREITFTCSDNTIQMAHDKYGIDLLHHVQMAIDGMINAMSRDMCDQRPFAVTASIVQESSSLESSVHICVAKVE